VDKALARLATSLALALALPPSAAGDEAVSAPVQAAEPARLAAHGLLIAIASAGERLVAVGDRGMIVRSDDRGASWTQAEYVPTQALLTGVCFLDAQHGVAVGHDEVILATTDGGLHWQRTHDAPEAQRPLLDVWCGRGGQVIAVGAYSAYLTSSDGGTSWREVKFKPIVPAAPRGARARAPAPPADAEAVEEGAGGGYHLNRIVGGPGGRLYIAAEAGHLYASGDDGASWRTLASPYEGSFFGVLPLTGDALLAFGLRGHLYRSADAGASWKAIETGTVAMLTGAAAFGSDAIAVVGLSGVVLVSRDGGRSFALQQQGDRSGLSAVSPAGDATLAVVGEGGARLVLLADTRSDARSARR
jgi:photosystem II stability/assembly factor-like uncharacterized protein